MKLLHITIKKLSPVLFYIIIAGYFTYLQWGTGFADPDSFYHAGVSALMGQGQLVLKQFPWFTFTTFSQNFTDHQFFYHLLLAIPSLFIPPLIATKALAVILATLFFIMFCRNFPCCGGVCYFRSFSRFWAFSTFSVSPKRHRS